MEQAAADEVKGKPGSNYLVSPLIQSTSVNDYLNDMNTIQTVLVGALNKAGSKLGKQKTGCSAKRIEVTLNPGTTYLKEGNHRLSEVMNQLATIERMIDVLSWISETTNGQAKVLYANPSQSDVSHDLVATCKSERWVAEVSDVVGTKDSNRKLRKDLCTLLACDKYETWNADSRGQSLPDWLVGGACLCQPSDDVRLHHLIVTSAELGKQATTKNTCRKIGEKAVTFFPVDWKGQYDTYLVEVTLAIQPSPSTTALHEESFSSAHEGPPTA